MPPSLPPAALRAPEPEKKSPFRSVIIRIGMDGPSPGAEAYATIQRSTGAFYGTARRYYGRFEPTYMFAGVMKELVVEAGCFAGIPARRRGGDRRAAIARMLADALEAYRAAGAACHVNRVLDTRMTAGEYLASTRRGSIPAIGPADAGGRAAAAGGCPAVEGNLRDGECACSAREDQFEAACPRCGRDTALVHRGYYPPDGVAAAAAAERRRRRHEGEPRPTLQWVRPHGKCPASNSHTPVILPAGAPRRWETGDFMLCRSFGMLDPIPHVYGVE